MKKVKITKYKCQFCNTLFDTKHACDLHERYTHKCQICKHCYYVYGTEQNCSRIEEKLNCKFEKDNTKKYLII